MAASRPYGSESATGGPVDVDEGTAEELAPCPSCGAMLATCTAEPDGHRELAIMHPMPFCDYFGRTEPEVILDDLMRKLAASPRVKA